MTLDRDEQLLTDALAHHPTGSPDLGRLTSTALRRGTRIRRRRQAVTGVAALAVVGAGSAGVAVATSGHDTATTGHASFFAGSGGSATSTPTPGGTKVLPFQTPVPHPKRTTSDKDKAVAVLEAPGWTCPFYGGYVDEKLAYDGPGGAMVSLNWRPAADGTASFTTGAPVATTTMDGKPAKVYLDSFGNPLVVGPAEHGTFLTLSVLGSDAGLTVADLADLAPHVHRQ